MEISAWKSGIIAGVGKYKYVLLVLLVGVLLMLIPGKEPAADNNITTITTDTQPELSERLEKILGNIYGAGEVMVMLSVEEGERVLYQTDTTESQNENSKDSRSQTVLVTDSQRNENGLVYQKNPPVYQGAIVLAEGADDPSVKLAIVDAVSKVTGLGANKISVLKMK